MQLHLYDLVAVRKQQLGTAQPLQRTKRSALADAAQHLALEAYPTSPQGKENTPGSELNSSQLLTLPLHAGQPNKAKQSSPLSMKGTLAHCLSASLLPCTGSCCIASSCQVLLVLYAAGPDMQLPALTHVCMLCNNTSSIVFFMHTWTDMDYRREHEYSCRLQIALGDVFHVHAAVEHPTNIPKLASSLHVAQSGTGWPSQLAGFGSAGDKNKRSKGSADKSLLPNNQHCRVARLDPQGVHLNQRRLQVTTAYSLSRFAVLGTFMSF